MSNNDEINVDELYTRSEDIDRELYDYKNQFEGKVIYCNCDDPFESKFFQHLVLKFNEYKLKKLIAIGYAGSKVGGTELHFENIAGLEKVISIKKNIAFKIEIGKILDFNLDGIVSLLNIRTLLECHPHIVTPLKGDGDFRSQECIDILKTVDIVITNPPFSLFEEYISMLIKYNKKFLIIGPFVLFTKGYFLSLIQEKKVWRGYNRIERLYYPEEQKDKGADAYWYTNLKVYVKKPKLRLKRKYNSNEYPKYLNYDAIECPDIDQIPMDYFGEIGTPINIFNVNFEDDFELIGLDSTLKKTPLTIQDRSQQRINRGTKDSKFYLERIYYDRGYHYHDSLNSNDDKSSFSHIETGKSVIELYARFVIKRKKT